MLQQLTVHNYAIVDRLDLELSPGMSAITGETGAGKSIMLDALGLALGARGDSSVVRPGTDKADILGSFEIGNIPEAARWLAERDLDHDGQCLLRRVITAEGRSRGYINGTPCTLGDLRELGSLLIDIHSQHEHQSLLKTDTQRRLLDEYAGVLPLANEVATLARQWKQKQERLQQLSSNSEEQQARIQLLEYQLEELDALSLGDDELEQLEQEQKTLSQAGQLLEHCRFIIDLCSEAESNTLLAALSGALVRGRAFSQPPAALEQCNELLTGAQIQIEEAVGELNRFIDGFDCDPQRQQWVEERLDAIYSLARKHRVQPHELNDLQQQLLQELEGLQGEDGQLDQLAAGLEQLAENYARKAVNLSGKRVAAAKKLQKAVSGRMQELGMPGGRFEISLAETASREPAVHGLESIEFLVSANPGQPLRPLAKVASGGELSRISLAIQVITAQTSRVPTLVFDEVDVGIGGPTAEIVGQLLRELGERGQVITVTHLPQVAACGHRHLFVHKKSSKGSTSTAVRELDPEQRTEELARMLGGVEMTEESLAHARKMLAG